jgi:hypothetical protein
MCGYTEAEVLELLTTARQEGWEEGYGQAQGDGDELLQSTQGIMYDAGKHEGRKEGYERGVEDGKERRRTAERESWETRHGPDRCEERRIRLQWIGIDANVQTEPIASVTTDSSTQTTTTTVDVDVDTQTVL